jgi:hypothetical protein
MKKTKNKNRKRQWRCTPCRSTTCEHAQELERADDLLQEIRKENGEAWERLRAKANWEQMTGVRVIVEYGDPRTW